MFKVKSQFIIHNFRAKIKDQIKLFCCQARVIKWQWQICTGLECANANTSCVKYNSDAYMPNIRNPRSMPGSDKLINQGITTGSIFFKIIKIHTKHFSSSCIFTKLYNSGQKCKNMTWKSTADLSQVPRAYFQTQRQTIFD